MIEYWHWHTTHFGTETYWIGILPHDQRPGRVYEQLSQLGAELATAGETVVGLRPDADIGLLYSSRSKWALAFQSTFNVSETSGPGQMDERSYQHIFEAFYHGTFDAGVQARIVHDEQLVGPDGGQDPAAFAAEIPVLVAPGLLAADDALLTWLRSYAEAGGHLVLGIRTAYGDTEGRARLEVKPAQLADAARVSYQEFSNLNKPLALRPGDGELRLGADGHATRWVDGLIPDGADVLAGYVHPHFGRFAAVTTTPHGAGRITTVGTLPDQAMARDLVRWLVPDPHGEWQDLPDSVTLSSATTRDGGRLHVVHNWSWAPLRIATPKRVRDVLDPDAEPVEALDLGAWDVRVVLEV
jgi:beta-galactosidase